MATNSKNSVLVDELLPEFLDTEGPKFQAFMRAYYEWLETSGQITDRSKNLLNYRDVDNTDEEFIKYFQREVMADFPENILANKALLITRIKDLYRSKGSEQSYKLLFRLLYDDEIDFYYPGEDMLRVSDGRWVQETSLRLSAPFTGDINSIGGKNVVGQTSGATAKVDRVLTTLEQGVEVFEIFLINIRGVFQDTEVVATSDNSISGVILSSIGPLQATDLVFGGSSHRVGDRVRFTSSSGVGANGAVLSVDGSSVVPVIADGGSGYTTSAIITLTGGSGSGATFQIDSINNTESISVYNDTISGLQNTLINANTYITSNTGAISSNLSIASSSTALNAALGTTSITVGTIASMSAVTRGSGYDASAPLISVREDSVADLNISDGASGIKGFNAVITANNAGGSIQSVSVDNAGTGYSRIDPITITNLSRSAQNATADPRVTGIVNYNGKYTDTKGFISWNNRIQDSNYYQQFAYVLRTNQSVNTYREIVKNIVHPTGTNAFGDLRINSTASLDFSSNTYIFYTVGFIVENEITSTLVFGDTNVSYTISNVGNIASSATFENDAELVHSISYEFTPSTVISTDITSLFTAGISSVEPTLIFGGLDLSRNIITTSIAYDPSGTFALAPIDEYSSNTVLQLQTTTFNSYYPVPQVGAPSVESS